MKCSHEYTIEELNSTPYDAPLRLTVPPFWWKHYMSLRGSNSTITSVPPVDLAGKNIMVTGANSGIGKEASLQFAAWGANVTIACRPNPPPHESRPEDVIHELKEVAKANGHEKSQFHSYSFDSTDLESVEALAKRWLDSRKPLDVLCSNAGMGGSPGGDSVYLTKDGFEIIHQVNFLSHVLLILSLLPALAEAKEPRIVGTTSCFHYLGRFDMTNMNGEKGKTGKHCVNYYQNNKLWFQTWLTELQYRLLQVDEYKKITVQGVHPGFVNSGIWTPPAAKDIIAQKDRSFDHMKRIVNWFAVDSQQGSLAIINAAVSPKAGPNPEVQGNGFPGGRGGCRYWNRVWEEEPMPHTLDRDCRMRVWRKVNDELKLEQKGLLKKVGLFAV